MDVTEFVKYLTILKNDPFALYPAPKGLSENKFTYVNHNHTHVVIRCAETQQDYCLPLTLVEFANPRVLRLTREVSVYNGSFL